MLQDFHTTTFRHVKIYAKRRRRTDSQAEIGLMSDSAEGLQAQLNSLLIFCSKFQMIVNEIKTKIMIYGKNTNDVNFGSC